MDTSKTYAHHAPSADSLVKIKQIRAEFAQMDTKIRQMLQASRELSLTVTKLEEAAMWAIKGLVMNDPASVAEPIQAAQDFPGTPSVSDSD
jgi:hypothetical protein